MSPREKEGTGAAWQGFLANSGFCEKNIPPCYED
jgi:hypothetical protein